MKHKKAHREDTQLGFIMLRRGLLEHLQTGKMRGDDLGLYVVLHFHADYQTGVVYHKSAPYFATLLRRPVWSVQRSLRRLEKAGYLKRFGHRGKVSGYDILIDRYLLLNCISTHATKSKSLQQIAWTVTRPCRLSVGQQSLNCNLGVVYVSPIIDIKNTRLIDFGTSRQVKTSATFAPPTSSTKATKQPGEGQYLPDSEELRLAQLLLDQILERKRDLKRPNLQSWALHIDYMIRIDGVLSAELKKIWMCYEVW